MTERLRIIVTGYILRWPLGGNAWPYLQYVMGLAQMGHDVYYVEESGESEYCCYNVETGENNTDPGYGLRFTAAAFDSVGLGDRWAYFDAHTSSWRGPCRNQILDLCKSADVLLRLPAIADSLRPWLENIPCRVLIDTDPVFTQLRHLRDPAAKHDASRYNFYFSFGENIALGTSFVPDDGLNWQSTRQPIVLDAWKHSEGPVDGSYTSVMKWESYRGGEFGGIHYGMKAESFEPFFNLPEKVEQKLELTIGGGDTPVTKLRALGWGIQNPLEITKDMWSYQDYLQASKGEFSIAKQGYVVGRSGWFSERSAAYLACGRPVLAQDTGFGDWLKTGDGLIAFSTPEEAVAGIDEFNGDYHRHCSAARDIALEYFDASKVLNNLLDSIRD